VYREGKERIIESMTGSAPKQGIFESDEKYRSRIAHDANERLVEKATGEAPRQGPFRWRETGVCPSGGSRSPAAWFAREIELQALASLAALAQISTVCRSFPKISVQKFAADRDRQRSSFETVSTGVCSDERAYVRGGPVHVGVGHAVRRSRTPRTIAVAPFVTECRPVSVC
jgi:hypothetical protein